MVLTEAKMSNFVVNPDDCRNPLLIGSMVLTAKLMDYIDDLGIRRNPLLIGSMVLTAQKLYYKKTDISKSQSPLNRVNGSHIK